MTGDPRNEIEHGGNFTDQRAQRRCLIAPGQCAFAHRANIGVRHTRGGADVVNGGRQRVGRLGDRMRRPRALFGDCSGGERLMLSAGGLARHGTGGIAKRWSGRLQLSDQHACIALKNVEQPVEMGRAGGAGGVLSHFTPMERFGGHPRFVGEPAGLARSFARQPERAGDIANLVLAVETGDRASVAIVRDAVGGDRDFGERGRNPPRHQPRTPQPD